MTTVPAAGRLHRRRSLLAVAAVTALAAGPFAAGTASAAGPAPAGPAVSGPVTGGQHGWPFGSSATPPATTATDAGYTEQEFFLHGSATSYNQAGTWGPDGKWDVAKRDTADYTTRALVERPAAGKFNGTVVVEWLNVSAGADGAPDFGFGHEELLRRGYAYVGISAQKVGVDALKRWDTTRYGALNQPGDAYSYDIYSQAAAAVRDPNGVLKGLRVKHVLGDGESQSAFRLTTYIDAIQPVAKAYEGFLVHSRGGGAAPINDSTPPTRENPIGGVPLAHIRADNAVPVLQLQTETDLTTLGFAPARQPDNGKLRTWELAGASHADKYLLDQTAAVAARDGSSAAIPACDRPINSGPAEHYIVNSAIRALDTWVGWGKAPVSGQQIALEANGAIKRDADGLAVGGIRTFSVDVPIETISGEGNTPAGFCALFGSTTPFTPDHLKKLYPTHASYVNKVRLSTTFDWFLLPEDKQAIVAAASKSTIGN